MPEAIIIHRHPIGAVVRGIIGSLAIAALVLFASLYPGPREVTTIYMVLAGFVGLVTIERVWTYSLATLTLTSDDIRFKNYTWVLGSDESEADWNTVQSSTVSEDAFGKLFGYGTLNIRTADANAFMILNYIPDVQAVADEIDRRADTNGPAGGVGGV